MLLGWKRTGLAALLAGQVGLFPAFSSAQTTSPQGIHSQSPLRSCAAMQTPGYGHVGTQPPQMRPWSPTPESVPSPGMPPKTKPPESKPPETKPSETKPSTPPETKTTPPITLPETNTDLAANPPETPQFALSTPQAGLGSPDVAFGGTPGMIGDFFGGGTGQFSVPLIIGRSILHATSVNGMPTQVGINDFHLINESLSPVGFQGGGGESSAFFLTPEGYAFAFQPNGDPIQPGMVSGLQGMNLTQYGFPPGSDGQYFFTATKTPDSATVHDQTSSDIFPNAPIYVITRGNGQSPVVIIPTVSPSTGGVIVGRQKTSENTSPIPRDRVFMNYNYFNNTPLFPGGVNVNRFSPGFEKTFFGGNSSVEVRIPFATTLSSNLLVDGATNTNQLQFGNMYAALKTLLYRTNNYAIAGGLAMSLPTGEDTRVSMSNGTPLVRVRNNSVHLMPFLGGVIVPNNRLFAQGFLQFDFDSNGNPVDLNLYGNGLRKAGVANDSTYMYLDMGLGYWMYRNTKPGSFLTGIAPTVELHYNRSLQNSDVVQNGLFQVGSFQNNVQILNALIGTSLQFGQNSMLTTAYVTPIGNGADQLFDGEARVSFNWFFGPAGMGTNPLSLLTAPFTRCHLASRVASATG